MFTIMLAIPVPTGLSNGLDSGYQIRRQMQGQALSPSHQDLDQRATRPRLQPRKLPVDYRQHEMQRIACQWTVFLKGRQVDQTKPRHVLMLQPSTDKDVV